MISFFWNLLISFDSILISITLTCLGAFYGWQILKLLTGRTALNLENLIFSIGLGFGLLSFFTLSLGLCNLLYYRLLLLLLSLLCLPIVYQTIRWLLKFPKYRRRHSLFVFRSVHFWLILFLFLVLAQLNIALLPPYEYDALEYHFGAPDYYLQQHKITYVPGNVYANFPANVEMLYTFGMLLNNDITGKLFQFYFGILTALTLFSLGKKLWSESAGAIAAVIFSALPLTFIVNLQANIDLALAGYSALAFFAFLNWTRERNRPHLVLMGIFIGLGLGCKYTAMLTIAIPLFLLMLVHVFVMQKDAEQRATDKIKGLGFHALCLIFCAFILVLPWCIKNLIFTSNPIFPLFYNILGGYGWTSELATKFMKAHLSFNFIKPFYQDFSRITLLTLLILLIPMAKAHPQKKEGIPDNKHIQYIFWYILFSYLFWFLLTEHIERFLMPVLPFVALGLGYLMYQYLQHKVVKYSLAAIAAIVVLFIGIKLTPALPPAGLNKAEWYRQFILDTKLSIYPAFEYINYSLPENGTVLFIAEARRHYLTRPVIMNTVFDHSLMFDLANSAKSPEDIYHKLRELHVTHIFLNPYELKRLTEFYGPYLRWDNAEQEQNFNTFFNEYTQIEWTWYAMKIYRLKS